MQWLGCRSPRQTFRSHGRGLTTMVLTSISGGSMCKRIGDVEAWGSRKPRFTLKNLWNQMQRDIIPWYIYWPVNYLRLAILLGLRKLKQQYKDFFSWVRRTTSFSDAKVNSNQPIPTAFQQPSNPRSQIESSGPSISHNVQVEHLLEHPIFRQRHTSYFRSCFLMYIYIYM